MAGDDAARRLDPDIQGVGSRQGDRQQVKT